MTFRGRWSERSSLFAANLVSLLPTSRPSWEAQDSRYESRLSSKKSLVA